MTNLRDQFHDEVEHITPDLHDLTRSARSQGLSERRRRRQARAAVALGSVAAVSAVAVGVWTLGPDRGGDVPVTSSPTASDPVATPSAVEPTSPVSTSAPATSAPASGEPVTLTGHITAALVLDAARTATGADLTPSRAAGQDPVPGIEESGSYGRVRLTGSGGTSTVAVNVQRLSDLEGLGTDCSTGFARQAECRVTTLPSGDVLRTSREAETQDGVVAWRVERLSTAADLRVSVSSSHTTGTDGALTLAQVQAVATDERWALQVPAEVAALVTTLPSYTLVDSEITPQPVD